MHEFKIHIIKLGGGEKLTLEKFQRYFQLFSFATSINILSPLNVLEFMYLDSAHYLLQLVTKKIMIIINCFNLYLIY